MKKIILNLQITGTIEVPDDYPLFSGKSEEVKRSSTGAKLITEAQAYFLSRRGIDFPADMTSFDAHLKISKIKKEEEEKRKSPSIFDVEPGNTEPPVESYNKDEAYYNAAGDKFPPDIIEEEPKKRKRGRPRKEVK